MRYGHSFNLTCGTNSTQPYLVDPLAFAVEQARKAGIIVVAAPGNTGYQEGNGAPGAVGQHLERQHVERVCLGFGQPGPGSEPRTVD